MATIKLTDAEWLKREADMVGEIIAQWLRGSEGKAGKNAADLKDRLEYVLGKDYYTNGDLLAIRDELVARGVIEIVG